MKKYEEAILAIAKDLVDQQVNPEFYSGSAWKAQNGAKADMVAFLFSKEKATVIAEAKSLKEKMLSE